MSDPTEAPPEAAPSGPPPRRGMDPGTRTRLIAGLSGLAVLLPAIVFGGPWAVEIVVVLVLGICVHEYTGMAFPEDRPLAMGWLGAGLLAHALTLIHAPAQHAAAVSLWAVATMTLVTVRPGPELERAADTAGRYALGFVWVGLLPMLVLLRGLDHGLAWCFVVLGISWLGDTGAYFAGRAFGRTKLYERISPKKTVEGAIGGIVTSTLGVFVIAWIGLPTLTPLDCAILGVLGCIAGILGDLAESMLKRSFGVKDSGTVMPGHGGMLDRIDSVLFVGALVYGYATLVTG